MKKAPNPKLLAINKEVDGCGYREGIDPSPSEILERAAAIRATWSAAEKLRRIRVDLRPQLNMVDGRSRDLSAEDMAIHYESQGDRNDGC